MGKVESNKKQKKDALFNTAFELFNYKGEEGHNAQIEQNILCNFVQYAHCLPNNKFHHSIIRKKEGENL